MLISGKKAIEFSLRRRLTGKDLDILGNALQAYRKVFVRLHRDIADLHQICGSCTGISQTLVLAKAHKHLFKRIKTLFVGRLYFPKQCRGSDGPAPNGKFIWRQTVPALTSNQ